MESYLARPFLTPLTITGTFTSNLAATLMALIIAFSLSGEIRAQQSALVPQDQLKSNYINLSSETGIREVDFLRVREAFRLTPSLENGQLVLDWTIADGYYLYKRQLRYQLETDDTQTESESELKLPSGILKSDDFFGDVEVYYNHLQARTEFPQNEELIFSIRSQGCADMGLCYPPLIQRFAFNKDSSQFKELIVDELASNSRNRSLSPNVDSEFRVTQKPYLVNRSGSELETMSFLIMIFFAFVGGVTLNLMPCVFPVLALKLLDLVNANTLSTGNRRKHGIAYTAGILSCFIAIGSILLGLRAAGEAIGWGFQLQSPWVVGALVYLFVVLGQSMSGYVEFNPSWMNVGQSLTAREGHTGSFFTGMLAVVVASPCTAPFMGTAVGFALVQPSHIALIVFFSLGLGMASPFLLASYIPRFAEILPKPGPWMATFKEIMAFPLYLTAVWLLWVTGRQTGENGMAMIALGCVLIFFGLWLWRRQTTQSHLFSMAMFLAALGILTGPWMEKTNDSSSSNQFNEYSAARVSEIRAEGQSVFVNLTADWCITCITNEKLALSRTSVLQAFSEQNIAYLRGDWTNGDPQITELLSEFNRSGVPLYLLYPKDLSSEPIILPQILTPTIILDVLNELKAKETSQ